MTAPTPEVASDSLVLAPEDFLTLVALHQGSSDLPGGPEGMERLVEAGLVVDGLPVEGIVPLVDEVANSRAELVIEIDDVHYLGWVGPELVVLLSQPNDEGAVSVLAWATANFAYVVVDLVGLGPRLGGSTEVAVVVGSGELQALLGCDPAEIPGLLGSDDADPKVVTSLQRLIEDFETRWRVTVARGEGSEDSVALEVLDTGRELWRVDGDDDEAVLRQIGPTELLMALCGLTSPLTTPAGSFQT